MLGKPYSLYGEVIHGNHLAQGMGFPTANIVMPDSILPPRKGVYLTETVYSGNIYRSITNIGTRPTITDDVESTAETHILNFAGSVYGQEITVLFYEFIRPEKRFNGKDELIRTVQENIKYARNAEIDRFDIKR